MAEQASESLSLEELTAITTLDGRYREKVAPLVVHVSEFALIRTRFEIEANYLIALSDEKVIRKLNPAERARLFSFGDEIGLKEARSVKKIEQQRHHDVKSVEHKFRSLVKNTSLEDLTEFIHQGLTSEDVNNIAYRLLLKRASQEVVLPVLNTLIDELVERADEYKEIPMLGRTHGQPAVPTTVGKELVVFADRLNKQVRKLDKAKLEGKMTGAVGNRNSLEFTYPDHDWEKFAENFVKMFDLEPLNTTTQINPYEDMIEFVQIYQRINGILMDLAQDMWRYISDDWFVQENREGEIGSSTMTQKINPINFENAEANLPLANAVVEVFSRQLPVTRLQRHLADSSLVRNIGLITGYSLLSYHGILEGLSRVSPNKEQLALDLNHDWSILGEAAQTLLRREEVKDPYSLIQKATKGKRLNESDWLDLVNSLPISKDSKDKLLALTPATYIGDAVNIVKGTIKDIKKSK